MLLSDKDLGWVAGFIEGEGTFGWAGYSPMIQAMQLQREPVERLKSLCGGNVCALKRPDRYSTPEGIYHRWHIYGDKAIGLLKAIYPLLSPRRKEQAKEVYTKWYRREQPKPERTHCKRGHEWTEENIYVYTNAEHKKRICKPCRLELQRKMKGN